MFEEDKNIVIFLGAGASKSASFIENIPLLKDIFQSFFYFYQRNYESIKQYIGEINEEGTKIDIFQYFDDFWGITQDNWNNEKIRYPTFEECYGVLDLAKIRRESYKGYNKKEIANLRNVLIYIMAFTYKCALPSHISIHDGLLHRRRETDQNLQNTSFVTTNYDMIMDISLKSSPFHFDINYGFEGHEPVNGVKLFKMHGSFNWIYCRNCKRIEIKFFEKLTTFVFYPGILCDKCGSNYTYMIVPPTFYKDFGNNFLREVNRKTEQVLKTADKIYFCGYSFSDADIHIKYLFKKAEIYRGDTPEIYIINNHITKTEDSQKQEYMKYYRFFKNKDKVNYTNLSFQQFCMGEIVESNIINDILLKKNELD